MKKLFGLLITVLILYVIYFDLSVGTLPNVDSQSVEAKSETVAKPIKGTPAFEAKVKPGETVITIVEHQLNRSIPVSIADLIGDFRALNPGQPPEKIQIGSTYQFPDYSKLR